VTSVLAVCRYTDWETDCLRDFGRWQFSWQHRHIHQSMGKQLHCLLTLIGLLLTN